MKKILILLLLSYSIITNCMNEEYSSDIDIGSYHSSDFDMEEEWLSDIESDDDNDFDQRSNNTKKIFGQSFDSINKIHKLTAAVRNKDIATINSLIEAGVDIEARDEQGLTALTTAVKQGFADIVIYLIDKGAKITGEDALHRTALMHAVLRNDEELVDLLLSLLDGDKKTINAQDKLGKTALGLAIMKGYKSIRDKLVATGAHIGQNHLEELLRQERQCLEKESLDVLKAAPDEDIKPYALNSTEEQNETNLGNLEILPPEIRFNIIAQTLENNMNEWNDIFNFDYVSLEALIKKLRLISKNFVLDEELKNLVEKLKNQRFEYLKKVIKERYKDFTKKELNKKLTTSISGYEVTKENLEEAVRLIIAGANVNKTYAKTTTLIKAARLGYAEIVRLLIDSGADIDFKDHMGWDALTWAIEKGGTQVVKLLMKIDDINIKHPLGGSTLLMHAAMRGHLEIVKLFIENGADIAIRDDKGITTLMHAAEYGHVDIVRLLMQKNIDLIKDNDGLKAIELAATKGRTEVVRLLIDNGVAINILNIHGHSLLDHAVCNGHLEVMRLLINHGAYFDRNDKRFTSLLMTAVYHGYLKIVKLLIEYGVNVELVGPIALVLAADNGGEEIVKLFMELGVDIDAKDKDGQTGLMKAASRSRTKMVKYLIENNASINIKDNKGENALMIAARRGFKEIIKLLIENGANVNDRSEFGDTALFLAKENNHKKIVELLKFHGAQ